MQLVGEMAALGTAFCWTVTALAFENAGRRIGSLPVNLIRLVMAAFLLSCYGAIARGAWLPTDASGHAWLWLSASGIVGFTFGDLCLFRAFVVVGARVALLLLALVPPVTAMIGWALLGELLVPIEIVGMSLTVGGIAWVVSERTGGGIATSPRERLRGVLLGIGGAVGQATGLVLSKFGMQEFDPFAATQIRVFAGIIGFAVVFTATGWWPRVSAGLRQPTAMLWTGLGAFFGPFLGVSLSLLAIQNARAGVAATIMALPPVLVIPVVFFIKKERVSPRAILGAVVAVSGTAVLFLS